jgi:5-methylcytosine-specific restriction endonuclease McrA
MFEVDDNFISMQRQKTRELRASRWWQNKIANQPHCHYCNMPLKKNEVTMDHIVPIIRGGQTTKSNIVISCRPCNQLKANLTPAEVQLNTMDSVANQTKQVCD